MKSSGQFIGAASFAALCGEREETAGAGALEGAGELAEKSAVSFWEFKKNWHSSRGQNSVVRIQNLGVRILYSIYIIRKTLY